MQRVLTTTTNRFIKNQGIPNNYLLAHRNTDLRCPKCNTSIEKIKISSRSCYYCPSCQSNK